MPVLVSARLAPVLMVVVWVWLLLALLASLSEVSVAVAVTVDGPATVARQVITMLRTSAPLAPSVPRLQSIWVGVVATQFWLAGVADTKLAPLGSVTRRRTLPAASTALLSTRIVYA